MISDRPEASIRRHPDGSIDYDYYDRRARTLRAQLVCSLLRRVPGPAPRPASAGMARHLPILRCRVGIG